MSKLNAVIKILLVVWILTISQEPLSLNITGKNFVANVSLTLVNFDEFEFLRGLFDVNITFQTNIVFSKIVPLQFCRLSKRI